MHLRALLPLFVSILLAAQGVCAQSALAPSPSVYTGSAAPRPTLFYLALRQGVMSASIRGESPAVLIPLETSGVGPDGIALDVPSRHIYWTTMGKVSANDGSVMRADFDGRNVTTIVPIGATFTPKQLRIDPTRRKLYWSDREGMRVMRANLDGSELETLIVTGEGDEQRKDASRWCVGLALDLKAGKVYWSQKGADGQRQGVIKRANLDLPEGQTATNRADIETVFAQLAEPIDLEIDDDTRLLYWTDRGDNTISRAPLDLAKRATVTTRNDREIIVRNAGEVIGIALDPKRDRLYYSSLDGVLASTSLNGRHARTLLKDQGALTGIVLLDY
jgi:sugar lactone lactonase YvrE